MPLVNEEEDNLVLQVISGHCTVKHDKIHHVLKARSVVFLGRSTSAELIGEPEQQCRYIILVYYNVKSVPYLDLNHLCLEETMIDSFFAQKGRFCVLDDRQYINITLGEIRFEWENNLDGRETALRGAMENLMVKLARSFHSQRRFMGIRYLTVAKNYIHENLQQPLTVDKIAQEAGISRSYLEVLFSRYMRGTLVDYLHAVRCDHAAQLLSTTGFSIIDIAIDSGFNNRQHFARVFREVYGTTPSEYRQRNRRIPGSDG